MAGAAVSLTLAACGGNARQDAREPNRHFDVEVPKASFPASQTLSEHTHMVITIRNPGPKTIPDVAITITDASYNTSAQAFGERIDSGPAPSNLANASRPVWIVDRGPGASRCGFSCAAGGPGGASTAYANTWALGALAPGRAATFRWTVTAVKPGTHSVHYRVAAGLGGKAIAQLPGGRRPEGTFRVTIHTTPQQSFVNDQGQIVTTPAP